MLVGFSTWEKGQWRSRLLHQAIISAELPPFLSHILAQAVVSTVLSYLAYLSYSFLLFHTSQSQAWKMPYHIGLKRRLSGDTTSRASLDKKRSRIFASTTPVSTTCSTSVTSPAPSGFAKLRRRISQLLEDFQSFASRKSASTDYFCRMTD